MSTPITLGQRVNLRHPCWIGWQGIVVEAVNKEDREPHRHFDWLVDINGIHVHFFNHELETIH